MSAPETNALPPAPVTTMTRIASSFSKSSMICATACHMSSETALWRAGLLKMMRPTAPSFSASILLVIGWSSMALDPRQVSPSPAPRESEGPRRRRGRVRAFDAVAWPPTPPPPPPGGGGGGEGGGVPARTHAIRSKTALDHADPAPPVGVTHGDKGPIPGVAARGDRGFSAPISCHLCVKIEAYHLRQDG